MKRAKDEKTQEASVDISIEFTPADLAAILRGATWYTGAPKCRDSVSISMKDSQLKGEVELTTKDVSRLLAGISLVKDGKTYRDIMLVPNIGKRW